MTTTDSTPRAQPRDRGGYYSVETSDRPPRYDEDQLSELGGGFEEETGSWFGGGAVVRSVLFFAMGLAGLVLAFSHQDRLLLWSTDYGQVWVLLGYFLIVSVCGRSFWWGVDTIVTTVVRRRGQAAGK